jgi:hypothetical protein
MNERTQVREFMPGDTITVEVLRDFLMTALRHDAIADVLIERMAFHARRGRLDAVGLAAVLPELIGDVLHVARKEDWLAIAEALIDAARDDLPGRGEGR